MPSYKTSRHHIGAAWVSATLLLVAVALAAVCAPVGASNDSGQTVVNQDAPSCGPFASAPTATAVIGEPFSFEVETCGLSTPTPPHIRAADLPSGLSLHNNHDGTASITGTPQNDSPGQYTVTLRAKVGNVVVAEQSLVITVESPSQTDQAQTDQAQTDTAQTDTASPLATTTPAGNQPVIGVSIPDLITEPPATQAAWLANLKSIGIDSVRIGADWEWISYAGPGTYDWSQLDQEVASVRAAGMSIDMVISGTASWAAVSGESGTDVAQPADPAQFGQFAAAVAQRYAPQGVQDYEIWNEPNNTAFFQPAPNPAVYVQMLQASYTDIKAVDPSAFVITGGLAPETTDGAGDINEVTFLQDMYADGAAGYFDAVGDHPYSYPALPDTYEAWSGWSAMDATPTSLESVMAANGDASKPIWITEVGAPTGGPDSVGTAGQAEDLTQAIDDAKASNWIGALYIYTYEDSGGDRTTDEDWFGLLNADGSSKPAWSAVAAAIG